jgi:hypothetical protein
MTGWGSITLAEAQSSRWYSDVAKTTELAREIVSADEIHVKVPSLTSSTEIYVDYDGIRSDYAVTDTYGRNAVWSDYVLVMHMEGNSNDSSGNGNGTDTSMSYSTTNAKIAQAGQFNGTNSRIEAGTGRNVTNAITISSWVRNASTNSQIIIAKTNFVSSATDAWYLYRPYVSSQSRIETYVRIGGVDHYFSPTGDIPMSSPTHIVMTHDRSNARVYANGSIHATSGSQTGASITSNAGGVRIGAAGSTPILHWDGAIDEIRVSGLWRNGDWIVTEYNNQNNVGTFWGTVIDAGSIPANPAFLLNFV